MANKANKVSETVIRRLPIYHRFLTEVIDKEVERVSSKELSRLTGFTASQIRQDLNNFGGFGQQGYGYNAIDLRNQIDKILGMDRTYKTIVVGAGSLGSALAKYNGFRDSGFKVQALFDTNSDLIGKDVEGHEILNFEDIKTYIEENEIDVGIVTVPRQHAVKVINTLVEAKIKGIWNFAPIDINLPEDSGVIIENVRLNDSLLKLSYFLKESNNKEE